MPASLFAHLALRFGSHPENLATEALGFILQASKGARTAVSDLLRAHGATIAGDLVYSTQSTGADSARPDLVAHDSSGAEPVLIEVKFWAGLTANQPVAYLDRLRESGTLVVVAPAIRLPILWGELRRRCLSKEHAFDDRGWNTNGEARAVVDGKLLVLLSCVAGHTNP